MGRGFVRIVRGRAHLLHRSARPARFLRLTSGTPSVPAVEPAPRRPPRESRQRAARLTQRADLTFKQNRHEGRHGWLRLTPAYSVRLVEQILDEVGEGAPVVFDPFSGSGTTALCAAYRGLRAGAADINPFLVWLGTAKARSYEASAIDLFEDAARVAARAAMDPRSVAAELPAISHVERWWGPATLGFLSRLRAAIDSRSAEDTTLLDIAFCRTVMRLSNAAFNHQSMSFARPEAGGTRDEAAIFLEDVHQVAESAADNPTGSAQFMLSDSRAGTDAASGLTEWRNRVDLLITSPPYPNRMSYIRELRPYMYWLQFLRTGREAGDLDWQAIGGTWGVATSRLSEWQPKGEFAPTGLTQVLKNIRTDHARNGKLLANYVHRYFEDMFTHLRSMVGLLRSGARAHYIVGNSIFYGQMVPAEQWLAEQMAALGLCDVRVEPLRKRNSKKGLVEFRVAARRA